MTRTLILLALTACAPITMTSSPDGITLGNVDGANAKQAQATAEAHCEQFGKDARKVDANGDEWTYRCVERGGG